MEGKKQRMLLSRKPVDLADVYKQTTGRITPAEFSEMTGKEIKYRTEFENWNKFIESNFSEYLFWIVYLKKEDEWILVDTSGYDYPRYVGLIERPSDTLAPKEKIEAYKDHYVVMMNDLSKDELIEQLWKLKPFNEKLEEATEYSLLMDW